MSCLALIIRSMNLLVVHLIMPVQKQLIPSSKFTILHWTIIVLKTKLSICRFPLIIGETQNSGALCLNPLYPKLYYNGEARYMSMESYVAKFPELSVGHTHVWFIFHQVTPHYTMQHAVVMRMWCRFLLRLQLM